MIKSLILKLAVTSLAFSSFTASANTVIDLFTDDQARMEVEFGASDSSSVPGANILGLERDIEVSSDTFSRASAEVAFNQLIEQADIITLHCPLTHDTEKLVNQQFLSKMKNNAMLINSARGALIDNQALYNALQQQVIAYAVLDVLEQEPPPADHLLIANQLPNLKITAHIAWASIEAQQKLINILADNIASYQNKQNLNRIN